MPSPMPLRDLATGSGDIGRVSARKEWSWRIWPQFDIVIHGADICFFTGLLPVSVSRPGACAPSGRRRVSWNGAGKNCSPEARLGEACDTTMDYLPFHAGGSECSL
jgi:hypothetical protein